MPVQPTSTFLWHSHGDVAQNYLLHFQGVLPTMQYMKAKATPIYRKTELRTDGVKLNMVIWQLPHATPDLLVRV